MKKLLSIMLVIALSLPLCTTVYASTENTVDPSQIYARYAPELAEWNEDEIRSLSEKEINILFEDIFSVSTYNVPEIDPYAALINLSNFYRFTKESPELVPYNDVSKSSSTNANLSSYTGNIGVLWKRDYDKSPLSLTEITNNWWTLAVSYATETQTVVLGAGKDVTFLEKINSYLAGEITINALKDYLIALTGLTGVGLHLSSFLIGYTYAELYDAFKNYERNIIFDYGLKMRDPQLLAIEFIWTGTSYIYNYEIINVAYATGTENISYYNIPNPIPAYYGFWEKDKLITG